MTNPGAAELLEENKEIDEIISFSPFWFYRKNLLKRIFEYIELIKTLKRYRFDLAVDLRGDVRNIFLILLLSRAKHRISYDVGGGGNLLTDIVPYPGLKHKVDYHNDIAKYLGCLSDSKMSLNLTNNEIKSAGKIIKIEDEIVTVGLHPGARMPLKCYPTEKFIQALNLILREFRIKLYIFSSDSDYEGARKIFNGIKNSTVEIKTDLTIRELAGCISQLDILICNDSAPMHIASALDIPTIAIFGPSDSIETGPANKLSRTIEIPIDCRKNCDEKICYNTNYHECMLRVNPETVASAFSSLKELL